MPYSPERRATTHARIVDVASKLFRRNGYDATGVDTLMGEAGLTRGGFYAHFRDKAALFEEALSLAFDESHANLLERGLDDETGASWREAAARRYLSNAHRTHPDQGCPIPALAAEVARGPRSVRRTFAKRLARLADEIGERLGPHGRREALALIASWAGALLIARAVGDSKLAKEVLEAVRRREPGSGS